MVNPPRPCVNVHVHPLPEMVPLHTLFCVFDSEKADKLKQSLPPGDTLASNQSLRDSDTLVSTSQSFELGFFSPGSSKFRYLGIWYKANPDTVVWVANRNNPITGLQGVLTISGNRSLVLLNGTQSIVWSSNLSRVEEGPVARLLDSGNLVLFGKTETNSDSFLWQSFDFPCNMRIPDLKMGENNRTSLDQYLTSWKSADDPSSLVQQSGI